MDFLIFKFIIRNSILFKNIFHYLVGLLANISLFLLLPFRHYELQSVREWSRVPSTRSSATRNSAALPRAERPCTTPILSPTGWAKLSTVSRYAVSATRRLCSGILPLPTRSSYISSVFGWTRIFFTCATRVSKDR